MMYPTITMRELDSYIEAGYDFVIIDLRNRSVFEQYHIKGAVNIPYQELDEHIATFPKDKPLIFYCSRGGQSMLACNQLDKAGYQVINVANGIAFYRGKYLIRR